MSRLWSLKRVQGRLLLELLGLFGVGELRHQICVLTFYESHEFMDRSTTNGIAA